MEAELVVEDLFDRRNSDYSAENVLPHRKKLTGSPLISAQIAEYARLW